VDLATGEVRTLYTECEGQRLIGPNDLVFDRHGGFWFTDHGCGNEHSRQFGALYYALPDGSRIVRASPPLLAPNGVGLSPDETVVYVADTYMGRLWAFDVLARRGAAVSPFQPARGGQSAGLPVPRQPGRAGRWPGLRGHHPERRHHGVRPGQRPDRARRRA
jgi:gluconolactonase